MIEPAAFPNIILQIIEEFTDGFLIVDPRGAVVFFDEVLPRLTGWPSADLLGRQRQILEDLLRLQPGETDRLVQIPDSYGLGRRFSAASFAVEGERESPVTSLAQIWLSRREPDDKMLRLLERDALYNQETHIRTLGGSTKRVLDTSWLNRDEDGEITGFTCRLRDVTYLKNLEERLQISERNFLLLFNSTQVATILGFARLTEYRDRDTGKHLERIRDHTRALATAIRNLPRYVDYVTEDYIEDLFLSSILHDVGKVGIEDHILLKPGKLSVEEYRRIKEHARMGGDALGAVDRELRRESFLTLGKEIAYYHHEWWDGSGYPEGRKGEEIPLSARTVGVADVYDAPTTERPYKQALSHEDAVGMIAEIIDPPQRGQGEPNEPQDSRQPDPIRGLRRVVSTGGPGRGPGGEQPGPRVHGHQAVGLSALGEHTRGPGPNVP